ncbi:MAG: protein kinase, partial [Gemmataceae bacterium]
MTAMTTALSANLSHLELERELPETVSLTKCCESPLLSRLLSTSVIHSEDWDKLSREKVQELVCVKEDARLLKELESQGLLTRFQSARLRNGLWHGLILGNYRILDQIGAGGMGVVYRAEHVRLRRQVAIKVLAVRGQHQRALLRFSAEMRAVAKMNHPNVVCAIDAGKVEADELGGAELHYYVMEHIPGRDLEKLVDSDGPLPVARACGFMLQVANALIEADKLGLVHRDIKPSNVLITPEGEAKLLDFGLVHHFHSRLTDPNTTLGTIDYMAPEQAIDASTVDTRADVYGLGATLYWCLTGRPPFGEVNLLDMAQRITQEPPSARLCRPEIPRELDSVLLRLLAPRPMDRYQTPAAVARAIAPFCASVPTSSVLRPQTTSQAQALMSQRVLIVDDDAGIRRMCRAALETDDFACEEAENGAQCFEKMESQQFDLILLDIDMPSMDGKQVLEQLRRQPPSE